MSVKRKSRNVFSIPNASEIKYSQNLDPKLSDDLADEHLEHESRTAINSASTNTSDLEGILDLGIKISGLSSSSSFSWSEEYEAEIGKKVQLELEKLDRIFQGLETDPSPYDKDEIAEWKHYFPHLHVLGNNTPTNSVENSDASTNSDDECSIAPQKQINVRHKHAVFPKNRSSLANKRRSELCSLEILNPVRNYNSLPWKPKSLEIDQYLRISSIKSPDRRKRNSNLPSDAIKQSSKELPDDSSPEYTSLPFITAIPLKTQNRKRYERNKPPKVLILPPIENTFRSISATPRQASSKSMFGSLTYERDFIKKKSQAANLKSDLMKLFDHIPVTNR